MMFQSLAQIDRYSLSIHQLQKQKQSLKSILHKSKSNNKHIQRQVGNTINDKISKMKQKLQLCQTIEYQIENQEFIHGQFLVEELVYDVTQLPQWFTFVFQKEFDKQRGNFSGIAKRLYKQHGLYEKKNELANEIKRFQNLHKRYQSLNQTQRGCININSEAQTFQNRCSMLIDRFITFIQLIGSKIIQFVQENAQKSLNYSNQINSYAQNSNNFQNTRQNFNPGKTFYEQNTRQRTQIGSVDKKFRCTMPTFTDIGMNRGVSPGRCLNHGHMVGFNESKYTEAGRFNYREHMPKWMNRTLASFYS